MPAEDGTEDDREANEKSAYRNLQRVLFMQVRYLGYRVICVTAVECITLYIKQLIVIAFYLDIVYMSVHDNSHIFNRKYILFGLLLSI